MEILFLFAFISGLVTILAPCIWPILPIILSSTSTGGRLKPLGITLGIMISFGFFLLATSFIVRLFNIDPNIFRTFAVIIIFLLGLSMIIPAFSGFLESMVGRLTSKFGSGMSNPETNHGFSGGFITGLSLGVIWAPCAGPILASIATLSIVGRVNLEVFLVTFFYILGLGIPLFLFAYGGRRLILKSRIFSPFTGRIQQIFGVLMILTAIAIYTNFDKTVQVKLLEVFPAYSNTLISLESNPIVQKELNRLKGSDMENKITLGKPLDMSSKSVLPNYGKAPEFVGISKWLNTDKPLKLSDLKGKVVLVDFWTYTCINCIRTLPYITGWYEKYKDQNFVVIGIHTPEFEFEKNTQNVLNAMKQYKINYPVAQDNDYKTWDAYNNRYWPAKYLIDANGNVRYIHFGEGAYEGTEKAIQELLKEANKQVGAGTLDLKDQTPTGIQTPEIYLGSERAQNYYPNKTLNNGVKNYTLEQNLPVNFVSLGGGWEVEDEGIVSASESILELKFYASKVFLVMHPPEGEEAKVKVYLDGKLVSTEDGGENVKNGEVIVDKPFLYNLINLDEKGEHTLRLEFETLGTKSFAFTFG